MSSRRKFSDSETSQALARAILGYALLLNVMEDVENDGYSNRPQDAQGRADNPVLRLSSN